MSFKTFIFIILPSISIGIISFGEVDSNLYKNDLSTFKGALNAHLSAIDNRDYDELAKTITTEDSLTLIYPNGFLTTKTNEYLDSHRDFFEDESWSLNYRIIREEESESMGFALLECSFDSIKEDGSPFQIDYFLLLVFKKISGKWLLVHDQNTKSKFRERVQPGKVIQSQ